jgi:hypothetical protein
MCVKLNVIQEIDPFPLITQPDAKIHSSIDALSKVSSTHAQSEIIALLNISPTLTTRPKMVDLRLVYAKYQGYICAQSDMHCMIKASTWTLDPVLNDELIEIFVSKSVYHANYAKLFPQVHHYPQLLAWLKGDSESGVDIFGFQKSAYTFKDLKMVLEEPGSGGNGSSSRGKGKRKVDDDDAKDEKKKSKKSSSKHHHSS